MVRSLAVPLMRAHALAAFFEGREYGTSDLDFDLLSTPIPCLELRPDDPDRITCFGRFRLRVLGC